MSNFAFTQTRELLSNSVKHINEIREASNETVSHLNKTTIRIDTIDAMEIVLFRKIAILYFEELQIKVRTMSKEHFKSNPYKDCFKDRDEKNISYTDVLLFLFGKKQYEIIQTNHNEILTQIKEFKELRNHFAHNRGELKEEKIPTTNWEFKREDFLNGDFITKTETFLEEVVKLIP